MRAVDMGDITAPVADGANNLSPLFAAKDHTAPSVFRPENLLREARRQKSIPKASVPAVCVLDPDGDIVRAVRADGRVRKNAAWACYHTDMDEIVHDGETLGIVGCAVGAPFAVLVAEQMFASGCALLISVTSSGRIGDAASDASFVLIDRALRDEGTSLHYRPASPFAEADPVLIGRIEAGLATHRPRVQRGATWTTDAPFRETDSAIAAAASAGVLAVEMEAAALYAFAAARQRSVVCFAHVTNQMAQIDGDFEKGEANGARDALELIGATVKAWRRTP
ncbi:MAG TPA: nucleoside phosphorylase [Rhodopila sp.]